MHIDSLILEVTRSCNLKCDHCLRGCTQRLKMSNKCIHESLRNVSSIGTLTLTGGEPSLAVDVMENIMDTIRWRNISFGSVYVVSNGKWHTKYKSFLKVMERFVNWSDEPECSSLSISRDQYHEVDLRREMFYNEETYDEYSFVDLQSRKHNIYNPINEGRALQTGVGTETPKPMPKWKMYNGDVIENEVYISANGNVVSNCNMSFRRIDKENLGNVMNQSLLYIIESFSEVEEEEEECYA
jgi:hypothetical protein